MFGSIFNKIHALLTNQKAKQEFRASSNHVYDSLFDGPEDPWYTDVYYAIYRFFRWTVPTPMDIYRRVKWFIQRGCRGYSDRDLWSWSTHMNRMMPKILRFYRENKHGIPMEFCMDMDVFSPTYGQERSEEDWHLSGEKWGAVLDKMIAGFEAGIRCEDMPSSYEPELGEHPFRRPKHISREAWAAWRDEYTQKMHALMKRDEELFKEARLLLAEHWWSICD